MRIFQDGLNEQILLRKNLTNQLNESFEFQKMEYFLNFINFIFLDWRRKAKI